MPTLPQLWWVVAPGLITVVRWHLLGMPGHMLLLRYLPVLRKFCCLFHTEELKRHVEDITLFFLDMVLDVRFKHLQFLAPCCIVHA